MEIETRDDVKYIICDKENVEKFGRLVASSKKADIYQSFSDPKVAYKVYRKTDSDNNSIFNYGLGKNVKSEHQLIYNLSVQQKNVHLTEFPTGIITFNEKIVGQEVVYYEDYIPLDEFAYEDISLEAIFDMPNLYLSMLNILRELLNAGIFYEDIRCYNSNFIVSTSNLEELSVKLIDFENSQISFVITGWKKHDERVYEREIIRGLSSLINYTNRSFGLLDENFLIYNLPESFNKMEADINEMKKTLQKKKTL